MPKPLLVHASLFAALFVGVAVVVVSATTITTATYEVADADESMTAESIGTTLNAVAGTIVDTVDVTALGDTRVIPETCPAGSYSTLDSSTCTNCPPGTYSPTTSAVSEDECIECEAGSYSETTGASLSSTCISCVAGEYSATVGGDSEAVCETCPIHSHSPERSQSISACVCSAGYSGPNGGPCSACEEDVWCLNGRKNPCPLNSESPVRTSLLSGCLCSPGFYGDAALPTPDSATICKICKEDHFCPGGAVNYTEACADGKYSLPGADDIGDCVCPVHAESRQMSSMSKQCVCRSGYYRLYTPQAVLGGWMCEECVPGEFCYDNSNRTCPPHSVSDGVAKSVLDCYCKAGFANSTVQTEQAICVDCPVGHYCEGAGAKARCVDNAVSPPQSSSASQCFCDWGWEGVENEACTACASPTFCYSGIQAQCSEGTYSEPLSWDRNNCSCIAGRWGPTGGPCVKCAVGKYNLLPGCVACTDVVDTDCSKCEEGTASNVEGRASLCDPCPNGTYSGPAGATECLPCPNGTFSQGKAKTCTKCTLGWFAAEGATQCTACPRDTYLDQEGKGSEKDCVPCPLGTVSSLRGNSDPACSACPPGTYQLDGECTACPAGTYSRSASIRCSECGAGTYSAVGATTCDACDAGAYSGTNASSECQYCAPGSYAEYAGSSACTLCAVGYYVEYQGADACAMCTRGQFAAMGASEVSHFLCVAYVFGAHDPPARSPQCTPCPKGSWTQSSIGGEAECNECGTGKYSVTLGATTSEACVACAGGTFSVSTRADEVSRSRAVLDRGKAETATRPLSYDVRAFPPVTSAVVVVRGGRGVHVPVVTAIRILEGRFSAVPMRRRWWRCVRVGGLRLLVLLVAALLRLPVALGAGGSAGHVKHVFDLVQRIQGKDHALAFLLHQPVHAGYHGSLFIDMSCDILLHLGPYIVGLGA
jgi:hypothetical protein